MIVHVEKRSELTYLYKTDEGVTGLTGDIGLLGLMNDHGATEEVEDYLRNECGWVHL